MSNRINRDNSLTCGSSIYRAIHQGQSLAEASSHILPSSLLHWNTPASQRGVVIVEVMIAILIFSMGVLAIVGLQAAMIKNTADSKFRADAGYIAQQQIGQLWADPDNLPADGSTINPDISGLLPNGTLSITRSGNQFTVTVTWRQPGEATHNYTTIASIAGG